MGRGILITARGRIAAAGRDAAATAVAVGVAWLLARWLAGHERPMFAVISTVICLAPGLPNHGRQAVSMLAGVLTGMVIGEISLRVPVDAAMPEALRLAVVTLLAILAASVWGQGAVTGIQSGVSALMVLTMGPVVAGPERLIDVSIGTAVGLVFSQVLLTPDPVRVMERAARGLLGDLAQGMRTAEAAVRAGSVPQAQAAARQLGAARGKLVALDGGIDVARDNARWSLRGWMAKPQVRALAAGYDRRAARTYAQALILGDELYHALRDEADRVPPGMADLLHHVAGCLEDPDGADRARLAPIDASTPHWAAVAQQAVALSTAGRRLLDLPEGK